LNWDALRRAVFARSGARHHQDLDGDQRHNQGKA
jgi:hypothetical protein